MNSGYFWLFRGSEGVSGVLPASGGTNLDVLLLGGVLMHFFRLRFW